MLVLNIGHKQLLLQPILVDILQDASTTLLDYNCTSQNAKTNFSYPENLHYNIVKLEEIVLLSNFNYPKMLTTYRIPAKTMF